MSRQSGLLYIEVERAVLQVYDELVRDGEKPASEHWTLYDHPKAKEMVRRVRKAYAKNTGSQCAVRAYVIAEAWMAFRKAPSASKADIRERVGLGGELRFVQ